MHASVVRKVFEGPIVFICGQFASERDNVELAQYVDGSAGLWVMHCSWEPIHPKELLSCRYTTLAVAKIDSNVVDTVRVDNGKVLVAGIRADTVHVQVAKLDTQPQSAQSGLLERLSCPFLD